LPAWGAGALKQIVKPGITLAGLGLATGVGFLLFGVFGPFYRTEAVRIPIDLQVQSRHRVEFTVDRTEEYLIEAYLASVFTDAKMEEIVGDFVAGGGGKIDISWQVGAGSRIVAQGSNAKFGYSPIFGEARAGLVIGIFSAQRGQEYHLLVDTHNENNDWNRASPYIRIALHPSKLESYIGATIFGAIFSAVFGLLFLAMLFIDLRSNKRKIPDQLAQPEQPPASR
jgi:hypothetical protein